MFESFPILSGITGLNWWTKIIIPDNLVHTKVITNWSFLEYITARYIVYWIYILLFHKTYFYYNRVSFYCQYKRLAKVIVT